MIQPARRTAAFILPLALIACGPVNQGLESVHQPIVTPATAGTPATATVPGCPDWERKSGPELQASTTSNYGCAVNAAIAAMIVDPAELLEGTEGDAGENTETAVRAVRMLRDAPLTGSKELKRETTGGSQQQ